MQNTKSTFTAKLHEYRLRLPYTQYSGRLLSTLLIVNAAYLIAHCLTPCQAKAGRHSEQVERPQQRATKLVLERASISLMGIALPLLVCLKHIPSIRKLSVLS
ncbi:hypothetical protein J6590_093721 [Homalodisca vitripennis]|nr:hypothetical protein J6590_093721 [Homalodisca vitripennis]